MSVLLRVQDLIAYVEQGKIIEAMHDFYAPEVQMQENLLPACVGLADNIRREEDFAASIATVHENRAASYVVSEDSAAIHWIFDFTDTGGRRLRFDQIAYQQWREGKIVSERFFYDTASLAQ